MGQSRKLGVAPLPGDQDTMPSPPQNSGPSLMVDDQEIPPGMLLQSLLADSSLKESIARHLAMCALNIERQKTSDLRSELETLRGARNDAAASDD